MEIRKISRKDLVPSLWDGGKTYQYFISPEKGNYAEKRFLLRISSATIEKLPSTFTKFKGFTRFLVMINSPLQIERNGKRETYAQSTVFKFDSADEITSFSKGIDFNLMVRKDYKEMKVLVSELEQCLSTDFAFIFALKPTYCLIDEEERLLNSWEGLLLTSKQKAMVKLSTSAAVIFVTTA